MPSASSTLVSMNNDVYISTFCPKDSGGDKSLLAFHSHIGKKEKGRKKNNLAGIKLISRRKKPSLDIASSIPLVLNFPGLACVISCTTHSRLASKMCVYQSLAQKEVSQHRLAQKLLGDCIDLRRAKHTLEGTSSMYN